MKLVGGVNKQVVLIATAGLGIVVLFAAVILLVRHIRGKKRSKAPAKEAERPEAAAEPAVQAQGLELIRQLEAQLAKKTLEAEQFKAKCEQLAKELTEARSKTQSHIVHAKQPAMPDETKRILVVDDNEKTRKEAVEILRKLDYRIETAANGITALHMIEDSAPRYYDLVLMDAIMPEIDGYETASRIRALNRRDVKALPILVMAANTFEREHRLAREAHIDGGVSKPLNAQELGRVVQRHLPFDAENFNYII